MMNKKLIDRLQILSISLIWLLFTGIAVWILNLIKESLRLHDARMPPSESVSSQFRFFSPCPRC